MHSPNTSSVVKSLMRGAMPSQHVQRRRVLCAAYMKRSAAFGCSFWQQKRSVMTGHLPVDGESGGSKGWEMRSGHHLTSSVGLHSSFKTACGRSFNPQQYYEMLQACCDHQWLAAIQRELRTDTEYMDYLRQHGGAAKDLQMLTNSSRHDDEFMMKLRSTLESDKKVSLSLCAVLESYIRIIEKRDRHETQVAADGGKDPYASMKRQQTGQFGNKAPQL